MVIGSTMVVGSTSVLARLFTGCRPLSEYLTTGLAGRVRPGAAGRHLQRRQEPPGVAFPVENR